MILMAWFIYAAWAAVWLIKKYMIPKPRAQDPRALTLSELSAPRAVEGHPVPIFWGTVLFRAPNIVWWGNFHQIKGFQKGFPAAGNYAMSMHLILGTPGRGYGEPTATNVSQLNSFWVGGFQIWFGELRDGKSVEIVKPYLFGSPISDTSKKALERSGDGMIGSLSYLSGHDTQDITGLTAQESDFTAGGGDLTLNPSYVGQALVVMGSPKSSLSLGFMIGKNPTLSDYAFGVWAPCVSTFGANPRVFDLLGGDANPVCVIADILTNYWNRLGLPTGEIDESNFYAIAQKLEAEQHGFSLILYDANNARSVLDEIMSEISGFLSRDQQTGKYQLRLIRDDYNPSLLPIFNEDNIIELQQYSTSTYQETFNEVRVIYTDRFENFTTRPVVAHDTGNIQMQGRIRSVTLNYPGITHPALAAKVAARELFVLSVPLAKLRIKVTRDAYALIPGDLIKVTWPDYGLTNVIFRVQRSDLGQPGDEAIILDCILDRFGLDRSVYQPQPTWPVAQEIPLPILIRKDQEAPRWFLTWAAFQGEIPSLTTSRLWRYVVASQPNSAVFRARITRDDGINVFYDSPDVPYPGAFEVASDYQRELDPYDTTTGLIIQGLVSEEGLQTATAFDIQNQGKNLILVDDEIMAYESFTDLGGGVLRLNNVWRGLLDTPATRHSAGARGYLLSSAGETETQYIGGNTLITGESNIKVKEMPRLGSISLEEDLIDFDRVLNAYGTQLVKGRTNLPYPVADLCAILDTAATSGFTEKAPLLVAEGTLLVWKNRDYERGSITRGDAADEVPLVAVQYAPGVQKVAGTLAAGGYIQTEAFQTENTFYSNFAIGGHGLLDVSVDTAFTADNATMAWDRPRLRFNAPHWRNLLSRGLFLQSGQVDPTTFGWDITEGDIQLIAGGFGGKYPYVTGVNTGDQSRFEQRVYLTGWAPEFMQARLTFYTKMFTDTDDTVTVNMQVLDASGTVLQTATFGPTVPSLTSWTKEQIIITALPEDADSIRVKVSLIGEEEFPVPDTAVANFCLRVGQFTSQLLTNQSFESSLTGWTQAVGSWSAVSGSVGVDGANVARAGSVSAAELTQTVAIPAGYEIGSTAELRLFVRNSVASSDTYQVILEALNAGSSVVSSISTSAAAPGTGWIERIVTLDMPVGADATQIKVRLLGARVDASTLDIDFDALELRVHKHLDPDFSQVADFENYPQVILPQTREDWWLAYGLDTSAAPIPDYALYPGITVDQFTAPGNLGIEIPLVADATEVFTPSVLHLPRGREEDPATDAYHLQRSNASVAGLQARNYDDLYMNWKSTESFTVFIAFKVAEEAFVTDCGLIGRLGTTGWSLELDSSGRVNGRLVGTTGTLTQVRSQNLADGSLNYAALVVDQVANEMRVYDSTGVSTTSLSSIGSWQCDQLVKFMVGRSSATQDCLPGQVARVYAWRRPLSTAQIQGLWRVGASPSQNGNFSVTSYSRTGTVYVPVGEDTDGNVRMARFHQQQIPVAYGSDGWGLAAVRGTTNLAPTQDFRKGSWVAGAGITKNFSADPDVEGLPNRAVLFNGTNASTNFLSLRNIPLSATSTVRLVWFARSLAGSTSARVQLLDDSDVLKSTFDYTISSVWKRYETVLTGWTASTANGRLRFFASSTVTSGSIELSAPIFISQGAFTPEFLPPGGTTVSDHTCRLTPTIPLQMNHEGELRVEGVHRDASIGANLTLAEVNNATNDKNRHRVYCDGVNQPSVDHYDATSTGTLLDSTKVSAITWSNPWTISGVWNRTSMLYNDDGSTDYLGTVLASGATAFSTTVSSWTVSTTALSRVQIGAFGGVVRRVVITAREIVRGSI